MLNHIRRLLRELKSIYPSASSDTATYANIIWQPCILLVILAVIWKGLKLCVVECSVYRKKLQSWRFRRPHWSGATKWILQFVNISHNKNVLLLIDPLIDSQDVLAISQWPTSRLCSHGVKHLLSLGRLNDQGKLGYSDAGFGQY